MATYTIRPSNSEKAPFRVYLTSVTLLSLKLRPGDLCNLTTSQDDSEHLGIAWQTSDPNLKDNIVQTSKTLQGLYGLKLGDKIHIRATLQKLSDAKIVMLRPTSHITESEQTKWSLYASAILPSKHDVLATSQMVTISLGVMSEDFEVVEVGGGRLGRINKDTEYRFGSSPQASYALEQQLKLDFTGVGGLDSQIRKLRLFIAALFDVELTAGWPGLCRRQGVLLYGARGTGKSLLQAKISQAGWSSVVSWTPGQNLEPDGGFQLVTIDFDRFTFSSQVATEVESMFNNIRGSPVLVVAAVEHPTNLDSRLRRANTFAVELELPIPDAGQRLDILRALKGQAEQPNDQVIQEVAQRTHGFVGQDLNQLLHEIWYTAFERVHHAEEHIAPHVEKNSQEDSPHPRANAPLVLAAEDVESALIRIGPSALNEIFLDKPNVRWTDIGGNDDIKKQLRNVILTPFQQPERMRMLGLEPKKGILLYGPPGCAKTMVAKALACETDMNFLVVKGAEIVSKYVGESEKATREVFRKARLASPSIIFFDEIDAIASRERSGSDLNVLTTLLNEMDGFEESRNVFVIAATNKPWRVDDALLRPGRFDNVVYVGPPNTQTRRAILENRLANVQVEEIVKSSLAEFADATEGCSGAEIVAICQTAGEIALDADRDFMTKADISEAIKKSPRNITMKMLQEYEQWINARMA